MTVIRKGVDSHVLSHTPPMEVSRDGQSKRCPFMDFVSSAHPTNLRYRCTASCVGPADKF